LPNGSRKKGINGKRNAMDLRRDVLNKKTGGRGRAQKEGSASGSKESTPDVESVVDDDPAEPAEDPAVSEVSNERWASTPSAFAVQGTEIISSLEMGTKTDQPFQRDVYKLIANSNIFIFFHIFANLYQRLKTIKDSEQDVKEDEKRVSLPKPAKELGSIPASDEFFYPLNAEFGETYYTRTLKLIDDFIANDLEEPRYQEFLRNYYLRNGWRLYSITDLLKSLCKVGAICSGSDSKDKTPAILDQFYKNRVNEETTYNTEINMRKQAEKYAQGGELFMIEYVGI
jgi:paired amphipathic helix protein Sin3a